MRAVDPSFDEGSVHSAVTGSTSSGKADMV
jgi:hypothetical protein